VQEWWNTDENNFKAPSEHLFMKLGLKEPYDAGEYKIGDGKVCVMRNDPKEFVLEKDSDSEFVNTIRKLYETDAKAGELEFKNHFSQIPDVPAPEPPSPVNVVVPEINPASPAEQPKDPADAPPQTKPGSGPLHS
jgi:hypothetical protein